jgi:hypothetical protein
VPAAPVVSSPTHPDQSKWYANNNPEFKWTLPAGATGVSVLADKKPSTDPGNTSDGLVSSWSYREVEDGVWYFHIKLKNSAGWGSAAHYKFQIDTEPPESFTAVEIPRVDRAEAVVKFRFDAIDSGSGIDHYEVLFDQETEPRIWKDDGTHIYAAPMLPAGEHLLRAKAVDGAGNFTKALAGFTIDELKPPVITGYPEKIKAGEYMSISGKTYVNSKVIISVKYNSDEPKIFETGSGADGTFSFIYPEKAADGAYYVWAEVVKDTGVKSLPSESVKILVEKTLLGKIYDNLFGFLIIIIPLLILLILLISLLLYVRYKYNRLVRGVDKDVYDAEHGIHQALNDIKEDMQRHIEVVGKMQTSGDLTSAENKTFEQLKKNLEKIGKFVDKETEDIKKKIK